ncbi:hypothetical protein K402DRAFT_467610 [Aulographum hederae CBS 113979]|uniref:Uncharacterized protein n=1 Tax=Aulographum hederae CBS 113979 TaxID=1176131 RepID=A0A6G1GKQ8_9PEZI|nr:hypothetical protein K402DRAFT_467610 [Aulographum hederae CBS 113979]
MGRSLLRFSKFHRPPPTSTIAMKLSHPFQCMETCQPSENAGQSYLLAARGPKILTIRTADGKVTSSWPQLPKPVATKEHETEGENSKGPPGKKRKLSTPETKFPNITKLLVTKSQRHVIAVTGEDKCLRVFRLHSAGRLEESSQRLMPKRPCAIVLTEDESTILSADKFGDVYALPLIPSEKIETPSATAISKEFTPTKPAATTLTVHSKANRRALEEQMKRANNKSNPDQAKKELEFEHKILLGHVSMLTDLAIVTLGEAQGFSKPRTYILTADRDEHIRVSRGPPQAHIIENYCLGHTEFVSKICLPKPNLLVSGSGDDFLLVWDWVNSRILQRIDLKQAVLDALGPDAEDQKEDLKIAVSGIWTLPSEDGSGAQVLVACEGVASLFYASVANIEDPSASVTLGVIALEGNPLDVTLYDQSFVVSIDSMHRPNSTTSVVEDKENKTMIQAFKFDPIGSFTENKDLASQLEKSCRDHSVDCEEETLRNLLYSTENLRKRAGAEENGE